MSNHKQKCTMCNGTGRIYNARKGSETCPTCQGRGYIWV
ncbi:hypothetical protein ACSIGC_08190 [Tenacibaculum sp. ZS6-P6]